MADRMGILTCMDKADPKIIRNCDYKENDRAADRNTTNCYAEFNLINISLVNFVLYNIYINNILSRGHDIRTVQYEVDTE